jgi:hypothetical protein
MRYVCYFIPRFRADMINLAGDVKTRKLVIAQVRLIDSSALASSQACL